MSTDSLKSDALPHSQVDDIFGSDQQLHTDSDTPMSQQHGTSPSPSSTLRYSSHRCSAVRSDGDSDTRTILDYTQPLIQLELLPQEHQEKDALINKLSDQLAGWEELQTQLQEKDQLNRQYTEALQAAESTIAYLTACNLDSQRGYGSNSNSCTVNSDAALCRRCIELQTVLQEKEKLNNNLLELLNMTEKFITTYDCSEKNPETNDLYLKLETALLQLKPSSARKSPQDCFGTTVDLMEELQQHSLCQQEELCEENRHNAELPEKQRTGAAVHHCYNNTTTEHNGKRLGDIAAELPKDIESKGKHLQIEEFDDVSLNQKMTEVLKKCLNAAESAVASLAAHCKNVSSLASDKLSQPNPDLQMNLDKLQRALQERRQLIEPTHSPKSYSNQSAALRESKVHQELHNNLCHLYKVFSDNYRTISELQVSLQEGKCRREESVEQRIMPEAKGLPPSVQVQLETLHKALREKKKACKSLEEKLATALTSENSQKSKKTKLCFFSTLNIYTVLEQFEFVRMCDCAKACMCKGKTLLSSSEAG